VGTRRKLGWVALLYFVEGLPFGLVKDLLPVYFRVHGVSLRDIGLMTWIMAPWSFKVLWSPLVDQVGLRRHWIAGALAVMALALVAIPTLPAAPVTVALVVLLVVFALAAATQDIAIDAYTIELLEPGEEGIANGVRVAAYRAALIVGASGLLLLPDRVGWPVAWVTTAALVGVLAVPVLVLPRVERRAQTPAAWARTFRAWVARPGAPALFLFVFLYKLGDTAMGPMVRPFWVDAGLSLDEIAFVQFAFGICGTLAGALAGGALTSRWGIYRALWVLGLLQAVSNLGYAAAAWTHVDWRGIYAASLLESFTGGLGTAAFLAFLMNVCDKAQAATQYALLSALFNLSGLLVGGLSGFGAASLGYGGWFAATFLLALPAYAFLPRVRGLIRESAAAG
jgi:MFS transporter, PAT family, beta-lactamase induction signal transducer AmpG